MPIVSYVYLLSGPVARAETSTNKHSDTIFCGRITGELTTPKAITIKIIVGFIPLRIRNPSTVYLQNRDHNSVVDYPGVKSCYCSVVGGSRSDVSSKCSPARPGSSKRMRMSHTKLKFGRLRSPDTDIHDYTFHLMRQSGVARGP